VTRSATRPGTEDLTARARIRDAAVRLFTARGAERTTIRDVAREAGVSSGLVQHHFGTKQALRDVCDRHVLGELVRVKEAMVDDAMVDNPAFMADAHPEILGLQRYLARALIDGSPAAAAMFEQSVAATEAWLAAHRPGLLDDVHASAALMVAMESGLLAMHERLSAALGADVLEEVGHLRLARAKVAFYSTPLVDPELAQRMRRALDALEAAHRAHAGGGRTP
jgi:AcrR family transcriptional regulator